MVNAAHLIAAVMLYAVASLALADSWAPAQTRAAVSFNSEIVLRVIPGKSIGDVFGFGGEPKGKFAEGQWFRLRDNRYELYQTTQLLNPVAPLFVAVTNDGTAVTLDNWHNVGFGDIVVVYDADGRVKKKYRLPDLYPLPTIEKMKRSVSSIWWRCETREPVLDSRGVLYVSDSVGGVFAFTLTTGAFTYEPDAEACKQ